MAKVFCIAVEKQLDLPEGKCPLAKADCYWQHRVTGVCCFTENDLTTEEFCRSVGAKVPTEEDLNTFRDKLRDAV